MAGRYDRNMPAISPEQQKSLRIKRVLVAGCGGLGGYIIEHLARVGVGRLTAVDGDVFTVSNLNRQLLSTTRTLGAPKARSARERAGLVNPEVAVTAIDEYLTADNADAIVRGHDVIVDALDSGGARLLLAGAASRAGVPLVSGAIAGWRGRVFVVMPGDDASFLWSGGADPAAFGNLPFTAAVAASIEAAEAVKLLLGIPGILTGRMIEFDLEAGRWDEIGIDLS